MERDLGVLVDDKFNMSEQCAAVTKKAHRMLAYINTCISSTDEEVTILPYSVLFRPHLKYCFTFNPCYTKKTWTGWRGCRQGPQKRKG